MSVSPLEPIRPASSPPSDSPASDGEAARDTAPVATAAFTERPFDKPIAHVVPSPTPAPPSAAPGGPVVATIASFSGAGPAAVIVAPGSAGLPGAAPRAPFATITPSPPSEASPENAAILQRPYIPKPKPLVVPERTDKGYRTVHVELERAQARAFYITIRPPKGATQRTYVPAASVASLIAIATAPGFDPGQLWRKFSDLPLERPLPSRQLEEEMRALFVAFGAEMRR